MDEDEVELDPDSVWPNVPIDPNLEETIRAITRSEIASLAGLAMRRLQDENFTRSMVHNEATDAAKQVLGHFWGEVLAEYGSKGLVAGELDDPDVAEASDK